MLQWLLCEQYSPMIHQSRLQLSPLGIVVVYRGEQMRRCPKLKSSAELPEYVETNHTVRRRREKDKSTALNSTHLHTEREQVSH